MTFAAEERPGGGRVRSGSDAQQCAGRGKTSRDLQTPVDRDDLTRHPSELRTGERCDPLADIGRHAAAPERDSPALMFLDGLDHIVGERSEEHTSELQSLMRISYAVFCLKKKKNQQYDIRKLHRKRK